MKVLRYTEEVQKQIDSKIKAEPWMHIALLNSPGKCIYAIYVWDTRKVLEQSETDADIYAVIGNVATDNYKSLHGNDIIIRQVNANFKDILLHHKAKIKYDNDLKRRTDHAKKRRT